MPRTAFRPLSVEAVLALHEEVLRAHGGSPGIRDRALLESAVAAPQASFGGEALIRNAVEMAAAYLFYLCRHHPFVDGNKRTALVACLVFLEANNRLPNPGLPADAWEALVIDVAASRIDRDHTTRRLRALLRPERTGKKRAARKSRRSGG